MVSEICWGGLGGRGTLHWNEGMDTEYGNLLWMGFRSVLEEDDVSLLDSSR